MSNFKNIFKVVGNDQAQQPAPAQGGDINARIQADLDANPVLLFMKGSPDFPQCGFSAATVEALQAIGVPFASRDVLQDPELRQGIKEFSNWPTIPQVYVKGKFIGGCDIVTEMAQTGELRKLLDEAQG